MRSHSPRESAIGFSQMIARVDGAAAQSSTIAQCNSGWVATMQISGERLGEHLPVVVIERLHAEALAELRPACPARG